MPRCPPAHLPPALPVHSKLHHRPRRAARSRPCRSQRAQYAKPARGGGPAGRGGVWKREHTRDRAGGHGGQGQRGRRTAHAVCIHSPAAATLAPTWPAPAWCAPAQRGRCGAPPAAAPAWGQTGDNGGPCGTAALQPLKSCPLGPHPGPTWNRVISSSWPSRYTSGTCAASPGGMQTQQAFSLQAACHITTTGTQAAPCGQRSASTPALWSVRHRRAGVRLQQQRPSLCAAECMTLRSAVTPVGLRCGHAEHGADRAWQCCAVHPTIVHRRPCNAADINARAAPSLTRRSHSPASDLQGCVRNLRSARNVEESECLHGKPAHSAELPGSIPNPSNSFRALPTSAHGRTARPVAGAGSVAGTRCERDEPRNAGWVTRSGWLALHAARRAHTQGAARSATTLPSLLRSPARHLTTPAATCGPCAPPPLRQRALRRPGLMHRPWAAQTSPSQR